MTTRSVAPRQPRAAAVLSEAAAVWGRLVGPDGAPLGGDSSPYRTGTAPAAACYVMPTWAREQSSTGVPLWWIWPADAWGPGQSRRHELLLAAGLGLAAREHHIPTTTPALSIVSDGPTYTPRRKDEERRAAVLTAVETARKAIRDHDGLDPASSARSRASESLMLAAACYLLPEAMRESRFSAGVPDLWAWPASSWIEHDNRAAELTTGVALILALIEITDMVDARTDPPHSLMVLGRRTSTQTEESVRSDDQSIPAKSGVE